MSRAIKQKVLPPFSHKHPHNIAAPPANMTSRTDPCLAWAASTVTPSGGALDGLLLGAAVVAVVVTTADVNGTPPVVVVAPLKAGACVAADGSGVAVVLSGFKTLAVLC